MNFFIDGRNIELLRREKSSADYLVPTFFTIEAESVCAGSACNCWGFDVAVGYITYSLSPSFGSFYNWNFKIPGL